MKEHDVRDVTLRHELHALSKFFGHAIKQHWARENPIRNVEIPSDGDAVRIHVLSAIEEKQYFARATKHADLHDLWRLMLNQGMRPDEVSSLAKADVDLEHRKVQIPKGKSRAARRKLDLTAESCQILGARLAGDVSALEHERAAIVAATCTDLKADEIAKKRKLANIDKAIAVAKSPWVFPSRRNPRRHVSRVNNAHDRLCKKALEGGVELTLVLYDFRQYLRDTHGRGGDRPGDARENPRPQLDSYRRALRSSDSRAHEERYFRYEAAQMVRAQTAQAERLN